MIGILFFGVLFAYIFLAKFIINKTHTIYKTKKAKNIALAIMILIPTWDVILGFPIYAYLCMFESGTKIYKTVDNVEGFYVGEKDSKFEPHEPYKGYKYIDYREMNHYKPTGKYYRSYWIDSNTSEICIKPRYPDSPYNEYTKAYKSGKCIVKKEINESEVSRWEFVRYKIRSEKNIPIINIDKVSSFKFIDRKNKIIIGELIQYSWAGGWINKLAGYLFSGYGCSGIGNLKYEDIYMKILKPKKEEI